MPAGDLISADFQAEIRATLVAGPAASWQIGPRVRAAVEGLGMGVPKTADVDLHHAAGAYGSADYESVRVITIPLIHRSANAATAGAALKAMLTTWAPSVTDIPLFMQLPGFGKFSVNGRPRGFVDDLSQIDRGTITLQLRFDALNPTITYV